MLGAMAAAVLLFVGGLRTLRLTEEAPPWLTRCHPPLAGPQRAPEPQGRRHARSGAAVLELLHGRRGAGAGAPGLLRAHRPRAGRVGRDDAHGGLRGAEGRRVGARRHRGGGRDLRAAEPLHRAVHQRRLRPARRLPRLHVRGRARRRLRQRRGARGRASLRDRSSGPHTTWKRRLVVRARWAASSPPSGRGWRAAAPRARRSPAAPRWRWAAGSSCWRCSPAATPSRTSSERSGSDGPARAAVARCTTGARPRWR